ncbi:MAG: SMR family transporter [Arcanobacterium sp.]|nr:SMR family transporter [Arcanobacterium sp.]
MAAWIVLILSGACETVWAVALAKADGFRKLRPTLIFLVANVASIGGLGWAMRFIPTGTAYAVWTGIGAALTVIVSIITKEERASLLRIALLALLIASVVGLKVVS